MRRFGRPLLILGVALSAFGWFAVVLELTTDPDNLAPAALLAFVGTALSNLGFFLVMFGMIEDRILQSEAVVLAEMKEQLPEPR